MALNFSVSHWSTAVPRMKHKPVVTQKSSAESSSTLLLATSRFSVKAGFLDSTLTGFDKVRSMTVTDSGHLPCLRTVCSQLWAQMSLIGTL